MRRHAILLIWVAAAMFMSACGCRSCSSCHDYDPPVANCGSNACGCHRAGSVSGGGAGYVGDGNASGGYVDDGYMSGEYEVTPPSNEAPIEQPAAQP
jgi:hypothetical protein